MEAFENCFSLKSVHIRAGTERLTIESKAFLSCTSLEWVRIDNKHARIWYDAFRNCNSIKYVNINISVVVLFPKENEGGEKKIDHPYLNQMYELPQQEEKEAWKYVFPSCEEKNIRWRTNFPQRFQDGFIDRPTTLAAVQSIRRSTNAPQLSHRPLPYIPKEMVGNVLEHTE